MTPICFLEYDWCLTTEVALDPDVPVWSKVY